MAKRPSRMAAAAPAMALRASILPVALPISLTKCLVAPAGVADRETVAVSDLRYNLEISLEEAFNGKSADIRVPTSVTCDHL